MARQTRKEKDKTNAKALSDKKDTRTALEKKVDEINTTDKKDADIKPEQALVDFSCYAAEA